MTNKEKYRELCEAEGSRIPLFLQYWWMDTVCTGKQWDVLLAHDRQGVVTGALPYLFGSRYGLRYVVQPQLTQYNGPWIRPVEASPRHVLQHRQEVCGELIAQLQDLRLAYYCQCFAPEISDWLPFHWAGYSQTTRYTYVYEDISDPDRLLALMSPTERRKKIVDCLGSVEIDETVDAASFAAMHNAYWQRKGQRDLLGMAFVEHVCRSAVGRGSGLMLGLRDKATGELLGASFSVYDDRCAHSLMSATTGVDDRTGLNEALFWILVQRLQSRTRSFNFEGSMDKGIEYFYRSFGATQVPYFQVSKTSGRLMSLLLKMRQKQ